MEWSDEWTSDLRNKASSANTGNVWKLEQWTRLRKWQISRSHVSWVKMDQITVSKVTLNIVLCGRIASGFSQYMSWYQKLLVLPHWTYGFKWMNIFYYVYVYVLVFVCVCVCACVYEMSELVYNLHFTDNLCRSSWYRLPWKSFQAIFLGITKIWINHEDLTWPHGQNCLGSGSWLSNVVRNFPVKVRAMDW